MTDKLAVFCGILKVEEVKYANLKAQLDEHDRNEALQGISFVLLTRFSCLIAASLLLCT